MRCACAWLQVGLAAVAAFVAAGCSSSLMASAEIVEPAVVPVRAFPEIWLSGGHLEEDEIVLTALAEQLSRGDKHKVRRVDMGQLEALRRAGRIPAAAVVMLVDVRVQEDVRQGWDSAPVRVCGAFGCETQYQQVMTNVPWMRGVAALYVYEGPTARLLQRHLVRADQQGGDPLEMRLEVSQALARRVAAAVEMARREVPVKLYEVDAPQIEAALAAIRGGDWKQGRAQLEQAVRSAEVQAMAAEDRARVFYDLGLARRFAPEGGYSEQAFDAAARALRQALRLDPRESYKQALRELGEHREAHRRLVAQREAAKHNFALGQRAGSLPAPPANYQQTPALPQAQPAPPPRSSAEPPPEELFEPRRNSENGAGDGL